MDVIEEVKGGRMWKESRAKGRKEEEYDRGRL